MQPMQMTQQNWSEDGCTVNPVHPFSKMVIAEQHEQAQALLC